jgi:nitroreductase
MDIYEAVRSRRAVRAFTDAPVSREVLEHVLSAAAWAPSGSNIQPWHVYVLTRGPLVELKRRAGERVAAGDPGDERFPWKRLNTPLRLFLELHLTLWQVTVRVQSPRTLS